MLTSITSGTVLSSSVVSTSAISMTTDIGLPQYGVPAVIAFIIMLSAKEILSASHIYNRAINCSMNMSILPLLVCFSAIILSNVVAIL